MSLAEICFSVFLEVQAVVSPSRPGTRTDRCGHSLPHPALRSTNTTLLSLGKKIGNPLFHLQLCCISSFSSENRQVLAKYPTSEDEKGLGNRYQQTFHRDTWQRRNLIAFVLLANPSRSQVNLKSYQSLYSEFTPLPPNLFKCPRHLMSTHNYS